VSAADILAPFATALDLDRLQLASPRRFIFFCGGRVDEHGRPFSLRDLTVRKLKGRNAINDVHIVLAESATQLFRDSKYRNLVAFEEDIAQLADIIFLISESAGSLTELGAFSMIPDIARRLRVLVRDDHFNQDSFIKFGPLRQLEDVNDTYVCSFPWKTRLDGSIVALSAKPYMNDIRNELVQWLDDIAKSEAFNSTLNRHKMLLIYWIVYVLRGAILKDIVESLHHFQVDLDADEVRPYLYCMRVAEWVGERKYAILT
jgi:hypothetical protein